MNIVRSPRRLPARTLAMLLAREGIPVVAFPDWLAPRAPAEDMLVATQVTPPGCSDFLYGLAFLGDSLAIATRYARMGGALSPRLIARLRTDGWEIIWFSGDRAVLQQPERRWLMEVTAYTDDDDDTMSLKALRGRAHLYFPPTQLLDTAPFEKLFSVRKERTADVCVLVRTQHGLAFTEVDIKPSRIPDLDTFYGDGFEAGFHNPLLSRLLNERGGLAFLHGPPGGGKTTYVRHLAALLGKKKRLLIVQRALISAMGEPDFIGLLLRMERRPTVLLVEDAEDVVSIEGRSLSAATGTLLNVSDGLLNDISGVQTIVTFNCPVSKVDPALVRAGRNLGMHEFRALSKEEARRLATAMGRDPEKVEGPCMLAEVLAQPPIGAKPPLTKRYL